MSDRQFPYQDGAVTVLGPEIFASADGEVICWKGENYTRQAFTTLEVREDQTSGAIHELASAVRDLVSAIRLEVADRSEPASPSPPVGTARIALDVSAPEVSAGLADAVRTVLDREARRARLHGPHRRNGSEGN